MLRIGKMITNDRLLFDVYGAVAIDHELILIYVTFCLR